jgi:D-alanyl-D-alanine carboxypeptidase
MRFRFLALVSTVALLVTSTVNASAVLKMERIPSVFAELTSAKSLANPSMVLMNLNTGETVYSRDSKSLRKPASTLKLMSAL